VGTMAHRMDGFNELVVGPRATLIFPLFPGVVRAIVLIVASRVARDGRKTTRDVAETLLDAGDEVFLWGGVAVLEAGVNKET